jgi:hypothetical protein
LALRIEGANAFDEVAKELDSVREVAADGVDIKDSAPSAESAGPSYGFFVLIAESGKARYDPGDIDLVFQLE